LLKVSAKFWVLILDAAPEPSMGYWFGLTSQQYRIASYWVATVESFSVVEKRSLASTLKQCVMSVVGFLIWSQLFILAQPQIALHPKGCLFSQVGRGDICSRIVSFWRQRLHQFTIPGNSIRRRYGGTKDVYNYYHSQLQIYIECTFGMFTHRWAILRSAIPMNVSIQKTIALVVALAKLHNVCIVEANDSIVLPGTARSTVLCHWSN
jgi:hypothetical protein